jgi:hypothetical protein
MKSPRVPARTVVKAIAIQFGKAAEEAPPRRPRRSSRPAPSRVPTARPANGRAAGPTGVCLLTGELAAQTWSDFVRGWTDLEVVEPTSDRSRGRSHRGAGR